MELGIVLVIGIIVLVGLVGGLVYLNGRRADVAKEVASAKKSAEGILDDARRKAEVIQKDARLASKDEALRLRQEFEKETRDRKAEIVTLEKRILQKEESLEEKIRKLDESEKKVAAREAEIVKQKESLEEIRQQQIRELERVAGLTADDAKEMLVKRVERDADARVAQVIKLREEQINREAEKKAREILISVMQRTAVDYALESAVTVVELPSEEMKGRVIGREGRNIRAFEQTTGVDLIVDDTPSAVTLSCFEPVRREVARRTLEKLLVDGRIHPARIEEVYLKAQDEVQRDIIEAGEKAALEAQVTNLPAPIVQLLGRLKYRSSFGQNALRHSIECAYVASLLASELGVNASLARRGALLHDIGKAMDREFEGTHVDLSVVFLRKLGESEDVINAVESHHEDEAPRTIEAVLVKLADAISAARPGARRDNVEAYAKRIEKLETVVKSFEGVEKCYAISAGREVRVIVLPEKISDDRATKLAWEIARKVEAELEYPGEVKVTVIRETRASEVAH